LDKLSKERLINALKGLGFSKIDTLVYIFLVKNGPCIFQRIVKDLKLEDRMIDESLKELQSMGVVSYSIEKPKEFTGLPFDELIDLFVEVKKEQAKTMAKNKNKLLLNWKKIMKKNSVKLT
jgi:sugar-specific transcriptional regulator TrmB